MKKIIILVLCLLLLCGCHKNVDKIDDNYRVFYEIFVGSFSDSDGDGIGDLKGIINRLDYLNDGNVDSDSSLHVQGLWLSPIFKAGSYHKYDVIDYYSIDPHFGNMDDLKKLVDEAHKRNVKVILDMVINHTSNQNEWFREYSKARLNEDTQNKYYNYYTTETRDTLRPDRSYNIVGSSKKWWYECNFSHEMPELNFDNEEVRQEVLNIAKYYIDLGIDGFRFDAAKYIYFNNNKESIMFWDWYVEELKKMKEDIYLVGEVWSSESETNQYIKSLNCFNFTSAGSEGIIASTAKGQNINSFTNYVTNYLTKIHGQNSEAMYIPFIANHDTDRCAGYLTVSSKDAYMAANLYILCSGSPFIYYGEEIGLKGTRGGANTDANRRLAMLWGDQDTIKDPVGADFGNEKQVNGTVNDQIKNEDSLLRHYNKVIKFRNKYPQIARATYEKIDLKNTKVGGFKLTYNDEISYLIHNIAKEEMTIDISSLGEFEFIDYIGQGEAKLDGTNLIIGPQTSLILK